MKISKKVIIFFISILSLLTVLSAEEMDACRSDSSNDSLQELSEQIEDIQDKLPKLDWKVPNSCKPPMLSSDSKSFVDPNNKCSFYSCANNAVESAGICKKGDPKAYFINYGEKYCKRFSEKTSKHISEKGKVWLNKTLVCLQGAIIDFCEAKSCSTCDKIRELAYASHADCYTQSGLCFLSPYDLYLIGITPDIYNDVLNKDGLKQIGEVAGLCGGSYANEAIDYSKKQLHAYADKAKSWARSVKHFISADNERILE